jgi:pimeloyl-ACP methyl ester carboxylesterase
LVGESDIPDVHTHIGVIQAGIAGSKRVVLVQSGHLCHMEVPDVFNEAVLDFLGTTE